MPAEDLARCPGWIPVDTKTWRHHKWPLQYRDRRTDPESQSQKTPALILLDVRQTRSYATGSCSGQPYIEQHDATIDIAHARWHDFDVNLAVVPVPNRLANIDAVFDAGRKLFTASQIGADDRAGSIDHTRAKALDQCILGRPRTLRVRIPASLPAIDLLLGWSSLQLQRAPFHWRTGQATDSADHVIAWQTRLIDTQGHSLHPDIFFKGIVAHGLDQVNRILITQDLLCSRDDAVHSRRQTPFHQRQVANVFEALPQQERCHAPGSLAEILQITTASRHQQLLYAVDGQIVIFLQFQASAFVQPRDVRQFAKQKDQRIGLTANAVGGSTESSSGS